MFDVNKFQLVYAGSVKNLREKKKATEKNAGVIVFEYTDDYSIFDYGKMPDAIEGKGASMAMGSAYFFEQVESPATWKALRKSKVWAKIKDKDLRESLMGSKLFARLMKEGFPTHYRGMVDPGTGAAVRLDKLRKPSNMVEVDAVRIPHPSPMQLGGKKIWNYNSIGAGATNYLVPLECIFRFGLPEGTSLFERMRIPGYLEMIGLASEPAAGSTLPRPVVEFSTKLEPADRYVDYETALNICGLDNETFAALHQGTMLLAVYLLDLFSRSGITLWDGKFEFCMTGRGLTLADAITPDELRLTYKGVQISKEPLRQYYRKFEPRFVDAMKQAKKIAKKSDKSLADIVNDDLKCPPRRLDPVFAAAVSEMYKGLAAKVTGSPLFGGAGLAGVLRVFKKFGLA